LRSIKNCLKHQVHLPQNLIVPEPQDGQSPMLQRASAGLILVSCMLRSINFHYQPQRMAVEIHDVRRDWVLSTKLEAA